MTSPDNSGTNAARTSQRWAHVRTLVEGAVALPRAERASFLSDSCGTDDALRSRVEGLVAACDRAEEGWGFLSQSAGELAAPLLAGVPIPSQGLAEQLARLAGTLADRYRIERELGAGGMATVYLAEDVRHGRRVAIKVLHPELSAMVGAERFLAEIKTTAALQHPHILPLFESGAADGLLFYVMPLVEGETLRARINRERVLPVADAVRIASDIAGALDYAHRRGVIHRDVKPENILLHEGRPVLADFGIALAAQSAGIERITRPGLSLGTPHYMSPEQTTGEQAITARSDVYALGAVTYEMLTGEPPFTGVTVQQIVTRMRTEEPRALAAQRKHVPLSVEAAVLTALEKLPADRFESAADFARALNDPAFRGAGHVNPPLWSAGRQQRLIVALGAAVVVLAALASWGWRRSPDARTDVVEFTIPIPRDLSIGTIAATGNIAVSPDGRVIVFGATAADGTRRLYARSIDDAVPRALTGTDGGSDPFFSPDGRWIGFTAGTRLQKVAADGGLPQTVLVMPALGAGATWLNRDAIVFIAGGSLYSVPSSGGSPKLMAALDSGTRDVSLGVPVALDDGDRVLFACFGRNGTSIGLASLSRRTGRCNIIPGTNALGMIDGQVIYSTRENALMAAPLDAATGRITGVPVQVAAGVSVGVVGWAKAALSLSGTLAYRSGSEESRLLLVGGRDADQPLRPDSRIYAYPRFSPDGRRIAVGIEEGTRSDVWIHDIGQQSWVRLSSGGSANERPEWTPDGTRVLYRTDSRTYSSMWWRRADLGEPASPLLEGDPPFVYEGVITPDGHSLVYQTDNDIRIRALAGDSMSTVVSASTFIENQARVSPDGRWVAFVTEETGSDQVVVQPLSRPGPRVQVSANGGTEPVWSRDGKKIFYRAQRKFMVATVSTTSSFSVVSRDVFLDDRFATANAPHANYDVSPDGKQLLVLEAMEDPQIVIVHNWAAKVRARLGARHPPD
jgi:eukaryotic-like serine/threonine-protein kinase